MKIITLKIIITRKKLNQKKRNNKGNKLIQKKDNLYTFLNGIQISSKKYLLKTNLPLI